MSDGPRPRPPHLGHDLAPQYSAVRRGELLTVGYIYVKRAVHRLRDGSIVFRIPKSNRSRRPIALPPSAILLLRDHRGKEALRRRSPAKRHSTGRTSSLRPGRRITVSAGQPHAGLAQARGRDQIQGGSDCATRHTHATLLLKHNVHPKVVQERLGHSTIATTLDMMRQPGSSTWRLT